MQVALRHVGDVKRSGGYLHHHHARVMGEAGGTRARGRSVVEQGCERARQAAVLTIVAGEVCFLAMKAGAIRLLFLGSVAGAGRLGGGVAALAGGVVGPLAFVCLFLFVGGGGWGAGGQRGGCA